MFWNHEALSYVWGEASDRKAVTVDGRSLLVTQNLHDFLAEMCPTADLDTEACKRAGPFWIDAICINQSDNDKKGVQVNMMGDIERNCERCIV